MKEFVEGAITTNGLTLHYWRSNLPQPASSGGLLSRSRPHLTLVLLHGLTENARCWARVAAALRSEYNIVIPDSRGHGLSEAPETGYGIEDRAIDLAGLIETLELDRPVLIGYSLGAETAVGTAANYPNLVRAVVLEDPPWPGRFYGSTPEERVERSAKWREDLIAMRNTPRRELIQQAREQHPEWCEEEIEPWSEAKKQVSPNITNVVFDPRRRWSDYVRESSCPILLITGDPAKGAIVSEQTANEASLFMQDGRVVNIPTAGHSIHREQLDEYLKAVRGFLRHLK